MRKLTLTTTFIHNNQHITPEYLERVTRFPKIENTSEIMLKILRKQFFHTLQDQVHQLAVLNVPALIVGGRQSKGIPIELTQEVHRILTGSQLEIFDQCGHCPNDEHPEKFNQLVLDFLA